MRMRSPLPRSLVIALPAAGNGRAAAEMLSVLVPDEVPGYDTAGGVTVHRVQPSRGQPGTPSPDYSRSLGLITVRIGL
jgi:hypothetical protein